MWSEEAIKDYLKEKVNEERYDHVLRVYDTAVKMAEYYACNKEEAKLAALIHDIAKDMSDDELIDLVGSEGYKIDPIERMNPQLLHALAAAIIAKRGMGITSEDIFNSVRYHTTGREGMSLLEKVIFLADYIEPARSFPGVEVIRELAFQDIDKAMLMALENTIKYVIKRGRLLHTDTVKARNHLLILE